VTAPRGERREQLESNQVTPCYGKTWDASERLAGRQGFELGASLFSKVVMARDFWF